MTPHTVLPALVAERLFPQQARLAYPLMREVVPGLTLTTWLRYARRMTGRGDPPDRGILTVRRAASPILCGAVCYRRDYDPALGAILTAEHFVAVDLLHPGAVLDALEMGLQEVAVSLRCAAMRSMVDMPCTSRDLRASGHRQTGEILLRSLAEPSAAA